MDFLLKPFVTKSVYHYFALFLLLSHTDVIERRLRCRHQLEIFPPTRAVPQKLEKASIKQRAEQGV